MKNNETKIKQLNKVISDWNKYKNKWIFSGAEIGEVMKMQYGYENDSEFINNCLKYLVRENEIFKVSDERGKYFGYFKQEYFSPIKELKEFPFGKYSITNGVEEIFKLLNEMNLDSAGTIFSEESLFTTIIEYSTLNESNIKQRSMNIDDLEVIEKNNIENLYKIFTENEIKSNIDEDFLKNVHSRLTSGLAGTQRMHGKSGEFTTKQNFISGGYVPCLVKDKKHELNKMIIFFNEQPKDLNDAVTRIAIISYWFAGIHIFEDGNSRVGRFLISYYMFLHGFTSKMNFAISKSLNTLGGKEVFVFNQAKSWEEKSIENYINWFVNDLINTQWTTQTKQKIKMIMN